MPFDFNSQSTKHKNQPITKLNKTFMRPLRVVVLAQISMHYSNVFVKEKNKFNAWKYSRLWDCWNIAYQLQK